MESWQGPGVGEDGETGRVDKKEWGGEGGNRRGAMGRRLGGGMERGQLEGGDGEGGNGKGKTGEGQRGGGEEGARGGGIYRWI